MITYHKVDAEGPGIGDAFWLTALARNFKIQRPEKSLAVVSYFPEIFDNNPDVAKSIRFGEKESGHYVNIKLSFNPPTHAIDGYCQQLGLKSPYIRRNFIYLNQNERYFAKYTIDNVTKVMAIQSQAGPWTRNKDWIIEYNNEVISYFVNKGWKFIQIGAKEDKKLDNCYDFKGSVRETAAIMEYCKLFIGPVSGGMHLASAVNIPALIIFGGREDPRAIALENHDYIQSVMDCAPCWKVELCSFKKCMHIIEPKLVIEYIKKILVEKYVHFSF